MDSTSVIRYRTADAQVSKKPWFRSTTNIKWDAAHNPAFQKSTSIQNDLSYGTLQNLPASIIARRLWSGSDFQTESKYVFVLSQDELVEINHAIRAFQDNPDVLDPNNLDQLTPETFPLPRLGKKLREICGEIHDGQGFFVIRGLEQDCWTPFMRAVAYVGVTSYIGSTRACQDAGGSKMLHLMDHGMKFPGAEMRQAPYAAVAQKFHTDVCDILSMHVYETAAQGGTFKIASSAKIYNEIRKQRPDVIHTLAEDSWAFDHFTGYPDPPTWSTRPILLTFGAHGPSFCYSRRPLIGTEAAPRTIGVPSLSERQTEALEMVQSVAERHELRLPLRRGDVVLVNNLAAMHARDAFVDDEEAGKKRHNVRMWLRNEDMAWPTPECLIPDWTRGYNPESLWHVKPVWPLQPVTDPARLLFKKFSCS